MKTVLKLSAVVLTILVIALIVIGQKLREVKGYVQAAAQTTAEGLAEGLPREIRDKKLENDLARIRTELVERRVKLNQSARQVELLRGELKALTERNERDRRVLADACPILEAATREQKKQVKFASAELPLSDFQREIDDLLIRRDRDSRELEIKRDALARLEARQRMAEQALVDSGRVLEAAEREVALLKSRREHAEIEGRTLTLVNAISAGLQAPSESVGESLGRLRDEVTALESRNEAEQDVSPTSPRAGGETITREYNRLEALKRVAAELNSEKKSKTESSATVQRK